MDLLVHVRCRSPPVLAGQCVQHVLVLLSGVDHLGLGRCWRRRNGWQGKRRHDADLLSLLLLLLLNWLLKRLLLLLLDVDLRGGGLLLIGGGCGRDDLLLLLLVLMLLLEFEL